MPNQTNEPSRELPSVVDLLRRGKWASLPIATIAALVARGRSLRFVAGTTMDAEADAAGLAVVLQGLLRVCMDASDGRQVTMRYARTGDLHSRSTVRRSGSAYVRSAPGFRRFSSCKLGRAFHCSRRFPSFSGASIWSVTSG